MPVNKHQSQKIKAKLEVKVPEKNSENSVNGKEKRLKNLKSWKKGQSGNPKGTPKKIFTALIDELKEKGGEVVSAANIAEAYKLLFSLPEDRLKEVVADVTKPLTVRAVAREMLSSKGGIAMIETMLDRAHGKATQMVDTKVSGGLTIVDGLLSLKKKQQKEEF